MVAEWFRAQAISSREEGDVGSSPSLAKIPFSDEIFLNNSRVEGYFNGELGVYKIWLLLVLLVLRLGLAINRIPHFGVWSALAPALKFRGVWITAPALTPALHLLLQKPNFVKVKKN